MIYALICVLVVDFIVLAHVLRDARRGIDISARDALILFLSLIAFIAVILTDKGMRL